MLNRLRSVGASDLSGALSSELFKIDDLAHYGIVGKTTSMAFDPIQSLFALSTETGSIYVFGQPGVECVFTINNPYSIKWLRFIKGLYLVAVDVKSIVSVFNLETKKLLYEYCAPMDITCIETDPSLDWLFLGLMSGSIIVYDVDRGCITPFRIDNLLRSAVQKVPRHSFVVSIAFHPRDPTILLVAYPDAVIITSIINNEILNVLIYTLPVGAPGGYPRNIPGRTDRNPKVIDAIWHPNAYHVLTVHEDGSLVFWDAKEGTLLLARTVTETHVNIPNSANKQTVHPSTSPAHRTPITKVAWTCAANTDDTQLLIAGGDLPGILVKGLTFMDFGPTPSVQITSYKYMTDFYASPRKQKIFPTPLELDVLDFIMIPKSDPYFAGNHEPIAFMALLSSAELVSYAYPEGYLLPMGRMFPPSLVWLESFITAIDISAVPRDQWIGMMASQKSFSEIFKGGAPARRKLRRAMTRTVFAAGHQNGNVQIFDASHGEISESKTFDISLKYALKRDDNIAVTFISIAGFTAELSVASAAGEVVLYSFGMNKFRGAKNVSSALSALSLKDKRPELLKIHDRTDPSLKEGFMPICLVDAQCGSVSAIKNSNIGFVSIGYSDGTILIVDRRGPAVIFKENITSVISENHSKFLRKSRKPVHEIEYPTAFEFAISMLENDDYSSILLHIGTSAGRLITIRFLPRKNGGYMVEIVGDVLAVDSTVVAVLPYNNETGASTVATPEVVARLRDSIQISGSVAVVGESDIRIVNPPTSKSIHKVLDSSSERIVKAGLCILREGDSLTLTVITTGGMIKVYNMPALTFISKIRPPRIPEDVGFASNCCIMLTGEVVMRYSLTDGGLVSIWGRGMKFNDIPEDSLYDCLKTLPPRPTISTFQWMIGTQYTSPADFDLFIGGPRRPKSKAMLEQEAADREQQRNNMRAMASRQQQNSSYGGASSMYAQEQDRTWKLGSMQETVNNLGETTSDYLNNLTKFVDDQKSTVVKDMFFSKFGF